MGVVVPGFFDVFAVNSPAISNRGVRTELLLVRQEFGLDDYASALRKPHWSILFFVVSQH